MNGSHVGGFKTVEAVIKPIRDLFTTIHFPIHFQVTNVGVIFRFESPDGSEQGRRRILLEEEPVHRCPGGWVGACKMKSCVPEGVGLNQD